MLFAFFQIYSRKPRRPRAEKGEKGQKRVENAAKRQNTVVFDQRHLFCARRGAADCPKRRKLKKFAAAIAIWGRMWYDKANKISLGRGATVKSSPRYGHSTAGERGRRRSLRSLNGRRRLGQRRICVGLSRKWSAIMAMCIAVHFLYRICIFAVAHLASRLIYFIRRDIPS